MSTAYPQASDEIVHAADSIREWLLGDQVQINHGPFAGGILGWLERDGAKNFAYGEITGYWLSWISKVNADPERVAIRASAAVAFLMHSFSTVPKTRYYYTGVHPTDWRNRAIFSFDLVMMLRGLFDVSRLIGIDVCADAIRRIVFWLARFIDPEGGLRAQISSRSRRPLPSRWSTRPGAFQVKTAAVLLRLPSNWIPKAVLDAADYTLGKWSGHAAEHDEIHPRFYGLEGELLATGVVDPALAGTRIPSDGYLGENAGSPNSRVRADVIAQALRLSVLIKEQEQLRSCCSTIALARVLLDHVTSGGQVLFRKGIGPPNVWCAIFAHQALSWLAALESREPISRQDLI
jgi:hypothetical protein